MTPSNAGFKSRTPSPGRKPIFPLTNGAIAPESTNPVRTGPMDCLIRRVVAGAPKAAALQLEQIVRLSSRGSVIVEQIRERLQNSFHPFTIEKHASASEVVLRLSWDDAFVTLQIRDNGKGLISGPGEGAPRKRAGMGSVDMKERCAILGGGLSIRSKPGTGTEIAARVPRKGARAESVA